MSARVSARVGVTVKVSVRVRLRIVIGVKDRVQLYIDITGCAFGSSVWSMFVK